MKLALLITTLLISTTIFAQQGQGKGQGQGRQCRMEVDQFCAENRGNPEAMQICIAENMESFSPECQERVGQGKRQGQQQ